MKMRSVAALAGLFGRVVVAVLRWRNGPPTKESRCGQVLVFPMMDDRTALRGVTVPSRKCLRCRYFGAVCPSTCVRTCELALLVALDVLERHTAIGRVLTR